MASSTSSSSLKKSTTSASSLNIPPDSAAGNGPEPLYQVKLLSALRNGDPALIHPFLAEIGKEKRKSADPRIPGTSRMSASANASDDAGSIDTGAAALHLAIRCASLDTIALLLSHRAISPNGIHPPSSGTTPLHLAAALGRADVVDLLLEQEGVDDTLLDREGKSVRDVAREREGSGGKGKEVGRVLDDSRTFLNASYRSLLRSYILSPMPTNTSAHQHHHSNSTPTPASSATLGRGERPGTAGGVDAAAATSPSQAGPASGGVQLQGTGPLYHPHQTGHPPPALLALLSSPRAKHLDLDYLDDASGRGILHEAARRRDLRLLELAVRAGADVFVRDRRGKLPGADGSAGGAKGGKGRGEGEVKAFLRQLTNQDAALLSSPHQQHHSSPAAAPVLRGYLNKYTNVAKGWNTRWFVLKEGVLSYYRHQDDEAFASRGSMAVKNCVLKPPAGTERMRFEIHSGAGGKGGEKWYVKANHPVEASRWVAAISASVAWAKAGDNGENNHDEGEARGSIASGAPSLRGAESVGGGGGSPSIMSGSSGGGRQRLVSVVRKSGAGLTGTLRRNGHGGEADSMASDGGPSRRDSGEGSPRLGGSDAENGEPEDADGEGDGDDEEDEDDERFDNDSSASVSIHTRRLAAPHEGSFELLGNSATTQLELTLGLLGPGGAHDALRDALGIVGEFVAVARERDAWWRKKLSRARAKQSAWERSLASAVREGEVLERELRLRSRKRGSRFFDAGEAQAALAGVGGSGTLKARSKRPSVLLASTVLEADSEVVESPKQDAFGSQAEPTFESRTEPVAVPTAPARSSTLTPLAPIATPTRTTTVDTLAPPTATGSSFSGRSYNNYGDAESVIDTDEEDEFFDAIEANTIPNLVVHEALKSPTHSELALPDTVNVEPYAGYTQLREELLLSDARPSTSLWSVLKHSIGKDLTKISFPVFFNEPTSMLQRMAEDMEFSECLDVAAKERDAHRRIAFVAAFAMSNYSSTIGRIAKPFNPMLSETFEYVRIDKEYRYLSEQVSHHPPISACMAESPYWRYFGEVDAQNKFMGKSFEIRPTGVAHAELLLPAEFASSYPKATGLFEGKVREHYSWKKVTTNVSGFILGSPTIDHYGDMVITNHRTKDTCVLTFKPRGWRGKDAYEISGRVMNASGRVTYEISGRWNSQLIARQIGAGSGVLNPDFSVSGPNSPSATPEYILLWRNSEKPEGSPFNLTPFAITLNDCPKDTLKPYLCPTDCRLRPDQRAFELGKYEIANTLKNDQEEKQRATRKQRELGEAPPHKPRWFSAETDGDTGERVWTPARLEDGSMEYWAERERVWKLGGNQPWTDVAPIFIEEPDFIRSS